MSYFPMNYEINHSGTVYRLNATELAWLSALQQSGSMIVTALSEYNTDLQALVAKGLVTEDGKLTQDGMFVAQYAFLVHPMIHTNPLYALTYKYIMNPDTVGVDMRTKYESLEPKYNFQKRIKRFLESTKKIKIKSFEEAKTPMPITPENPLPDVEEIYNSSVVTGIAYDRDKEILDVHLKGGKIYRYSEVPSITYTALKTAQGRESNYDAKKKDGSDIQGYSIGAYYSKFVAGKFPSKRIA